MVSPNFFHHSLAKNSPDCTPYKLRGIALWAGWSGGVVHDSLRLELQGESMGKLTTPLQAHYEPSQT